LQKKAERGDALETLGKGGREFVGMNELNKESHLVRSVDPIHHVHHLRGMAWVEEAGEKKKKVMSSFEEFK